ncbi:hypothetical protein MMC09_003959 [Bachmanniomyces sp. S44760]|nr:hypothetical protein [Bachmanniomyces sp. S44760]
MEPQPLPDFTQAGLRFAEASDEMQQQFQRMNNVPTVQLQQIANVLTRLDERIGRLDERIGRLDERMGRLEAKFENQSVSNYNAVQVPNINLNSNHNNMARLQNHYATTPDDPIVPLINPTTGLEIPNFPADSSTITHMTGKYVVHFCVYTLNNALAPQIRGILQELGHRVPNNQGGGVALLKRQLRIQIGLRAVQVQGA